MKTMLTAGVAVSIRPCFSPYWGVRPGVSVAVVPGYPSWRTCIDVSEPAPWKQGLSTGSNAAKEKSVQEYPSKKYSIALNHLYNSTARD